MALVLTMGNFCYVECDSRNCNRKIEHTNETHLRDLADMVGWKNIQMHWLCPKCGTSQKANEKRNLHAPKKNRSRAQSPRTRSL